ncbi:MAG: STAS domain-containing protein [Bacteroidota bacterium]
MEITRHVENGVNVIKVAGKIDGLTSETVINAFLSQVNGGTPRLVADLEGVDYTSSAGLRALLAIQKAVRQSGGELRLASVQPYVFKVLDMSGFTSIFKIYGDVGSAVASFNAA